MIYAMKEIYQASTTPHDWQSVADGSLVGGWWALFLISNFMGQIVFRLALSAEELDELILSTTVTMASDLLDIALTIVTLALVSRVFNMQMGHLKMVSAHGFAGH